MSLGRKGFTSLTSYFVVFFFFFLILRFSLCSKQTTSIPTGFKGNQVDFIDNDGLILHSNNSRFYFGFQSISSSNPTAFLLVVVYRPRNRVVWTANRGSPVSNSDVLLFGEDGDVKLYSGDVVVWSTNTAGSGATSIEILDSGNLVLVVSGGKGNPNLNSFVWQSFDYPTDTLLPRQNFREGMNLTVVANERGLTHSLRVSSGDMILEANFRSPQIYWSISKDHRNIKNVGSLAGKIFTATIENNFWNIYDRGNSPLSQFRISSSTSKTAEWAAVLTRDGSITFYDLNKTSGGESNQDKVPIGVCDTPEPCGMYSICSEISGSSKTQCSCPSLLASQPHCVPEIVSFCGGNNDVELVEVRDSVKYFAIDFVPPTEKNSNLSTCTNLCAKNCSCVALFFDKSTGNCFLFDQIGSLQRSNPQNFSFFVKIAAISGHPPKKYTAVIVAVTTLMVAVLVSLVVTLVTLRFYQRRTRVPESSKCLFSSEEDDFFDTNISGAPVRYTYRDLQDATNDFSVKLGTGGFGSVYEGKLPDGSDIAVKKLEGIGQGKKEFMAEVCTIGSIHHLHLVRLRGFCSEGTHRLLAYEFMANGSLDRWIFQKNYVGREGEGEGAGAPLLDWDTRVKIAVGTAKGLAYLHEDCESKIVHCDIKPENVLLNHSFEAKVSDFGLAKMMTREQSHVFTTLRGTRGYLAPEWIISSAISEKSDVYSYGMVLLEIIGGRKNFDPSQTSDMVHFPSFAFKMMEEGNLSLVVDRRLGDSCEIVKGGDVEKAIKVALWCIQEDTNLRPSMYTVVQMLEGIVDVPEPPTSSHLRFRLGSSLLKTSGSKEGRLSSWKAKSTLGCNSDAFLSDIRLSGPR